MRRTKSRKRTLVKALILRMIVFTTITTSTIFIFGQSFIDGIEFAIMDIVIELLVYYVYDRIWLGIEWGMIENEEEVN